MESANISGVKVKGVSLLLIWIGMLLFVCSIILAFEASLKYKKIERITNDYVRTQQDIYSLKTASDYLTSKTRQYVMTGDAFFVKQYFDEVNNDRHRDIAVDNIKQAISAVGIGAAENIEKALAKSNELMNREIHAMRLIASISDVRDIPDDVFKWNLIDSELSMSEADRRQKAYSLVFGTGYSEEKLSIDQSVADATADLLGELNSYKTKCASDYHVTFILLVVFLGLTASVFIEISIALHIFVLKPLAYSIDAIQKDELIPFSKSYELNYLAHTYNKVYEENATTKLHLKNKAEHDALTGLLNRGAFENLKKFYSQAEEPIAFLLIDVDKFKDVNDKFGHETGDKALVRVSELLNESFRINDFPVRYGGDEFAVIMTGITHKQKGVIERKLIYINQALKKSSEYDLPELSISAGIAFSNHGFSPDLMEKADGALYLTKENGRNGYTFA